MISFFHLIVSGLQLFSNLISQVRQVPPQRHLPRPQRRERSQPVLEILCQVLSWVQMLCWVEVLGCASRTKATPRVLGAELGFQSRRGATSFLCASLSVLLYSLHLSDQSRAVRSPCPLPSFIVHHSPSWPSGPWSPMGPRSPRNPGLADTPPLPWGPAFPGAPRKPAESGTQRGVSASGREALGLTNAFQ